MYLRRRFVDTVPIDRYAIIGVLLLVPFAALVALWVFTAFILRSEAAANWLYASPIYWPPVLTTICVVLPMLALIINAVRIVSVLRPVVLQLFRWAVVRPILANLLIVGAGGCVIVFLAGHDVIPCTLKGVWLQGLNYLPGVFGWCVANA